MTDRQWQEQVSGKTNETEQQDRSIPETMGNTQGELQHREKGVIDFCTYRNVLYT